MPEPTADVEPEPTTTDEPLPLGGDSAEDRRGARATDVSQGARAGNIVSATWENVADSESVEKAPPPASWLRVSGLSSWDCWT